MLNRATANDPRQASAWFLLTSAYLRRATSATDETKASADYLGAVRTGEALTRLRSDEEAMGLYARALIGAQQYARAATALERVAAGDNVSGITLYLLGLSYSRANNFPKAIAALERAVAKTPNDTNAYRELGYDYEKSKLYPKAFATYERALKVAPDDAGFQERALSGCGPLQNHERGLASSHEKAYQWSEFSAQRWRSDVRVPDRSLTRAAPRGMASSLSNQIGPTS